MKFSPLTSIILIYRRFYIFWITALTLLFRFPTSTRSNMVQNYRVIFTPTYLKNSKTLYIALRAFEDVSNRTQFLVVNTSTLKTHIISANQLLYRRPSDNNSADSSKYIAYGEIQATPYMRALETYTDKPYPLFNGGLSHSEFEVKGAFMTVDLCPSIAKFERQFFEYLTMKSSELKQPIPVAICVSGLWILAHPKEFNWLRLQQIKRLLDIVWVNHSYNHLYFPDLPFKQNFTLWSDTRFEEEIMETERLLLKSGEIPSVFFRFPGLISDEQRMLTLRKLGLIPVGADAWLDHGEYPSQGSIILVHGNGNEPQGIEAALPLLNQFNWLPLNQACCDAND